VLVQSASKAKNTAFKARFHSFKGRVGSKKALIAAAAQLRTVYRMLKAELSAKTSPPTTGKARRGEKGCLGFFSQPSHQA
jgi:hypothetical protein